MVLLEIGIVAGTLYGTPIVVDRGKIDEQEEETAHVYYKVHKQYEKHISCAGDTFYHIKDGSDLNLVQEEVRIVNGTSLCKYKKYVEVSDDTDIKSQVDKEIEYLKKQFNRYEYRRNVMDVVSKLDTHNLIKY